MKSHFFSPPTTHTHTQLAGMPGMKMDMGGAAGVRRGGLTVYLSAKEYYRSLDTSTGICSTVSLLNRMKEHKLFVIASLLLSRAWATTSRSSRAS